MSRSIRTGSMQRGSSVFGLDHRRRGIYGSNLLETLLQLDQRVTGQRQASAARRRRCAPLRSAKRFISAPLHFPLADRGPKPFKKDLTTPFY
jgi:hypothetical protein